MAAFPPLFLANASYDAAHTDLVADFHAWQAPWLLSLAQLEPATRQRLEQQARQQALAVEKHYRLYPEVIDQPGTRAALVEAMLCRSQGVSVASPDTVMSTFILNCIRVRAGIGRFE